MRTIALHTIVLLGLIAAAGRAQTTAAAPAPAEYLQHFSKDYRTLFVIPDPLPNVQRVLTNPRLQRIWREGKFTAFMRKHEPQTVLPSLDAVWMLVLQNHRWVPSEIVMGVPESAWKDFDHVVRAALHVAFFQAAHESNEGPKLIPQLQKGLLAEMKDLRMPTMRLWVKFRAEEDCASLFDLISEFAQSWGAADLPLSVHAEGNALRIVMDAAKVLPTKEERVGTLRDFDLISGDDDPNIDALADALAAVKLETSLERVGDGLLLTLGTSPAGAALTSADLGPLHVNDDSTIFFGAWDIRTLITSLKGWSALWEQWANSPLGEAIAEMDDEDFGGDLRSMSRQLDPLPPIGSSRLWGDESAIRFRMLQEQAPPAPALVASPITALIPADIEGVAADTVSTLAQRVAGSLGQMETRLAQQEMKQDLRGQTTAAQVSKSYYQHFDPLRQFINHESQAMFKPGVAFLYGGENVITRAEIGSITNPRDRVSANNLPMIGFAAVAVPAGAQQGTQYIERLYGDLVKGMVAATKGFRKTKDAAPAPPAPPENLTKQEDLGLGVATWTFDLAWIKSLAPQYTYTIESDVRPHYFEHEGALVFSTSPKLSRRMLAAARNKSSLNPPAGDQPGTLVAYGQAPGKFMVRVVEDIGAWVHELSKHSPRPAATRRAQPVEGEMRELISGMAEYLGLVEKLEWRTVQNNAQRTTDGGVTFVK